MKFTLRGLFLLAAIILVVGAPSAFADTYQVSFTGSGVNGLLNLTATPDGPGTYLVTSVTGNVNGASVLGLIPPTTNTGYSIYNLPYGSYWFYDDKIFPSSSSFFDLGGLLFSIQGGSFPVNLFDGPGGLYGIYIKNGNYFQYTDVKLSVMATPEPSTLALALAGILAIATTLLVKKSSLA